MKETAARHGHANILSQAPQWFVECTNRNREARGLEPLNIRGRENNDHRFTAKQRAYNMQKAKEQAKPMTAKQRVQDKAKRLKAQRKAKR